MASLNRQHLMRSAAIQRVLAREQDRVMIGSPAELRRAYQDELAAHGDEIAIEVDQVFARDREITRQLYANALPCVMCGGHMEPVRASRLYCSQRCRQHAYRTRLASRQ
jgi:hypothetical protein